MSCAIALQELILLNNFFFQEIFRSFVNFTIQNELLLEIFKFNRY